MASELGLPLTLAFYSRDLQLKNFVLNVLNPLGLFENSNLHTFGAAGRKNRNRGPAKIKLRVAVVKPKSSYTRLEVSVAAHFQILESRNFADILKITAPSVNGKK